MDAAPAPSPPPVSAPGPAPEGNIPAGPDRQVDLRFALLTGGLGLVVFALAWVAVQWLAAAGLWGRLSTLDDVNLYRDYAVRWLDGLVPYGGFPVEYPPFALLIVEVPALLAHQGRYIAEYRAAFESLMLAAGLLMTGYVVLTAWRLGASWRRLVIVAVVTGALPLLIGPVILSRYDLVPAAFTIAAVAALLGQRSGVATVLLGLATMSKLYPALLVPFVVVYVWRHEGRRPALLAAGLFTATCAVIALPFLVGAPAPTIASVTKLASRPLHIEALGGAVLFVLRSLGVVELQVRTIANSLTLVGGVTGVVLGLQVAATALLLGLAYVRFVRGKADAAALVLGSAAAVATFVAFGKILSPQYLIWLVPLVAIVPGRRGLVGLAVLVVSLLLTAAYFPGQYLDYAFGRGWVAWIVLARDLALVVLVGVLLAPARWFGDTDPVDTPRVEVAAG